MKVLEAIELLQKHYAAHGDAELVTLVRDYHMGLTEVPVKEIKISPLQEGKVLRLSVS